MTTTVDAIYENGKILLPRPLSLPEKSHVRVTIESNTEGDDSFNGLLLSESALAKDWNTPEEDAALASMETELAAMARDPQIQRELRSINTEFAAADSDGLGKI